MGGGAEYDDRLRSAEGEAEVVAEAFDVGQGETLGIGHAEGGRAAGDGGCFGVADDGGRDVDAGEVDEIGGEKRGEQTRPGFEHEVRRVVALGERAERGAKVEGGGCGSCSGLVGDSVDFDAERMEAHHAFGLGGDGLLGRQHGDGRRGNRGEETSGCRNSEVGVEEDAAGGAAERNLAGREQRIVGENGGGAGEDDVGAGAEAVDVAAGGGG